MSSLSIYLKSNSGNVTDGMTLATETGDQNLVVFFDVVQATITRNECGDFLAVLDELDSNALADGGVRLLSFDAAKEKQRISKLRTGESKLCTTATETMFEQPLTV